MANNPGGQAPDTAPVALLLIDVINPFDFEGAEDMLDRAEAAAERIAALKKRCKKAGYPVVYCNDHFGRWREDFDHTVAQCTAEGVPGRRVAERLRPQPDDYFILKPRHSAFFDTTLPTLLGHFGAHTLVLAGFSGDICVLATAMEAFLREYRLVIPEDCTASVDPDENAHALAYARRVFGAETPPSEEFDLEALAEPPEED